MVRWEPDTQGRLNAAALQLYTERGYDETTVADIAGEVGVTERTFFRHFADKREVLFAPQQFFLQPFADAVAASGASAPFAIVAEAVVAASAMFPNERLPHSRQRHAVISAHPELRERELLKMASLATTVADALRARGVADPDATLAAEAGVVVFRVAWDRWLAPANAQTLDAIERELFAALGALVAA